MLFSFITLEVLPDLDSMKLLNFIPCCRYVRIQGENIIKQAKGISIIVYYQWKLGNF